MFPILEKVKRTLVALLIALYGSIVVQIERCDMTLSKGAAAALHGPRYIVIK